MARMHNFRAGLAQWRQAAVQRRDAALVSMAQVEDDSAMAASPHCLVTPPASPAGGAPTIRIGEFVISPEGDPRILGHPQIRY